MNILAIQFNCPTKFTPIAQYKMLQEVSKDPRVSSRDLQAALETVNMNDLLQSNKESAQIWKVSKEEASILKKEMQSNTYMRNQTSGTICPGQMSQRWRCLVKTKD